MPKICEMTTFIGDKFIFEEDSIRPTAGDGNRCLLNAFFGAAISEEERNKCQNTHFSLMEYSKAGQFDIVKRILFRNDESSEEYEDFKKVYDDNPNDDIHKIILRYFAILITQSKCSSLFPPLEYSVAVIDIANAIDHDTMVQDCSVAKLLSYISGKKINIFNDGGYLGFCLSRYENGVSSTTTTENEIFAIVGDSVERIYDTFDNGSMSDTSSKKELIEAINKNKEICLFKKPVRIDGQLPESTNIPYINPDDLIKDINSHKDDDYLVIFDLIKVAKELQNDKNYWSGKDGDVVNIFWRPGHFSLITKPPKFLRAPHPKSIYDEKTMEDQKAAEEKVAKDAAEKANQEKIAAETQKEAEEKEAEQKEAEKKANQEKVAKDAAEKANQEKIAAEKKEEKEALIIEAQKKREAEEKRQKEVQRKKLPIRRRTHHGTEKERPNRGRRKTHHGTEKERFQEALSQLFKKNSQFRKLSLRGIKDLFHVAKKRESKNKTLLKKKFSSAFQKACYTEGITFSKNGGTNTHGMRTRSAEKFAKNNHINLTDALKKATGR